ncbi:hypothetical protein GJR96_06565 [Haloferax sp. MBLA0076]|uniref:Uncharacterized protein n=1 Tax=Haloferax litoreum TaxID=2666140 RepID=A0A6A8GHL7_9EURY|nr:MULTISPECIES: DUF6517 family protein [Haloferax]KAB1193122.1 hypothetical protein Hfx1148_06555 [Haloferax sp. CBA1148]MRX21617.1 hypothetical protein [Haloferax litoreum]
MPGQDDTNHQIGRRTYLGVAASAGLAGLAGCSSGSTASAARGPPKVPVSKLEDGGWEQVDEQTRDPAFEESFGPVSVSAAFRTLVFEDVELATELKEKTLGQAEGQFSMFFATRVTLDPSLATIPDAARDPVVEQVETQARAQFESQLESAGLSDIEQASTGSMTVETGESARVTNYTASFPFEGITFPLTDEKQIAIEGKKLGVSGFLAVWEHDGSILVAGGAHPGENLDLGVTKEPTSAIEVSVDIDLGLTPDAYREELRSLVTAVE